MSFILDALRKSENERRKHAPPGHADVRVMPTRQSRRPWIAFVGVLLGANVILLAIFWFGWYRNSDSVSASNGGPATSATLPDSGDNPDTGIGAAASAKDFRVRNLSKEAGRGKTVSSAASSSAAQRSGDITARVATSEPTSGGNSAYANLPTMNEAIVAGILSVPPLHLDIHVYSPSPAERFVFINMAKYREGERLQEGPAVEEITESGVVMIHQGSRFLLSRE
jgi:general secretion pathway protein B